ncbi:hypothetical protein GCM10008090_24520 [Arenicella chitinivorans]|uniref:OmpR/PhoB-type domain-containing protein n=1 Tax=Arenicella chitinivorans TaxID=1329800 RepID=A0A918VP45_9GAMM|nr:winged helix-turn-helix domain-containing protein [Arenicella chitinivorans]GHA13849.1 hypothetical protein GCM10008090_24520 [Arenicella chitinivorans]
MKKYQSADLLIDPSLRTVHRAGELMTLSPLTFDLLLALIQRAPATADSDDLLTQVWSEQVVGPETLTQRVAILRKQLALDGHPTTYIESVRSRGYRWIPAVELVDDANPVVRKPSLGRNDLIAVVGLMICAVVAYAYSSREPQGVRIGAPALSLNEAALAQAWRYYDQFDAKGNGLARNLFARVLAETPDSVEALVGLSATYSQEVTKFNGNRQTLDQARVLAQRAVQLEPESATALWALGFSLDAAGELDAAISAYQQSLLSDPENSRVAGSLAYLFSVKGDLANAMKTGLLVLDSDAHYRYLQLAHTLRLLQFDLLAEHWYTVADELNPDSVFAAKSRAEFLYVIGRLESADQLAEEAIARGVNRPELHLIRAMVSWDAGEHGAAMARLDAILPAFAQRLDLQVWRYWFTAQLLPGSKPNSSLGLESLADERPVWPSAWIDIAVYHMAKQDADTAIRALQQAVELGYRDIGLLRRLAPFRPLHQTPQFQQLMDTLQNQINAERQSVIRADWLPAGFLDITKTIED